MAISSGISFKRISDSVSKTKSVAAETGKTTIRISKLLNKNISDKRNISSDIKSLKSRRIQREKRNILIDRMSAPLIAIKPTGPRILSASDSGTSVVNRLLGFVGYLTAGWALSNLPTWIGLGEQFVTRITIATSILGNYGDELLKVITDVGDVFSSVVQNLSRFDFSDSSYLVRSSLNELKLSIDSLGDGISQAFQVLIQPFSAIEKIPDAYDKLPSILPGFDGPEPPPSGGSGGKWKPLLDLIASGESSSSGGYDAMYPGRNTKKEGKPVSKMTISQAGRYAGDPGDGRNYAVGRYQFTTVKAQAKAAGLNPDKDTFSPENQDRMAINIIEGKRKGKYWLSGKITDEEFSEYLAGEWGAFRSASGYVLPGNTGSIGFDKLKPILKKVKSTPSTAKVTPSPTGQTPSVTPTGQRRLQKGDIFTKSLGKNVDYIQIGDLYGSRGGKHGGIDILIPSGTYISLRADCEVVGQGTYGDYGLVMDVWVPAYGVQLRMAHLSAVLIKTGKIPAGTSFARVGATGNATGPHIHFEYDTKKGRMTGGGAGNPEAYVRLLYLTSTAVGKAFSGTTPLVPGAPSISTQQAPEVNMESTIALQVLLGGLSQEREGRKVVVVDDRQPSSTMMIPSSDNSIISDISVDESSILNSLIKNRFLLDLSYV